MVVKILITGAAGQVGREIVDLCEQRKLPFTAYTSSQLDITDEELVMSTLQSDFPTHVINAAAYTAVDQAENEKVKAFAVNAKGPENLALSCKTIGAKLLHISTDYIFDGKKEGAYIVDDASNPTSVYGASKLAGEHAIASTFDDYIILRVSWVFGQYGNNFVKTMLKLAQKQDEISVVNDQFGAPTSAKHIAQCLLSEQCLNRIVGVQHLESNPGLSWKEFADEIFSQSDLAVKVHGIPSSEYPTPVIRPANSKLASDQFKVSWLEALEELLGDEKL